MSNRVYCISDFTTRSIIKSGSSRTHTHICTFTARWKWCLLMNQKKKRRRWHTLCIHYFLNWFWINQSITNCNNKNVFIDWHLHLMISCTIWQHRPMVAIVSTVIIAVVVIRNVAMPRMNKVGDCVKCFLNQVLMDSNFFFKWNEKLVVWVISSQLFKYLCRLSLFALCE